MLFDDFSIEEIGQIRYDEGVEDGLSQARSEVLELLEQGLSVEEIKQRLTQTTTN